MLHYLVCKEVGHLQNTCPGKIRKQSTWKVDWSERSTDAGFSAVKGANSMEEDSIINSINLTSFIGKLKLHAPALFSSLSSKKLDWLHSLVFFFRFLCYF
jgi:hypothetical protein